AGCQNSVGRRFCHRGRPGAVRRYHKKMARVCGSNRDLGDFPLWRHAARNGAQKHPVVRRQSYAAVQVKLTTAALSAQRILLLFYCAFSAMRNLATTAPADTKNRKLDWRGSLS